MNQNILNDLIDNRNKELWHAITDRFKVTLVASPNNEYSVYLEDETATFYIPKNICIDSFTHEILHVYLRLKEVSVGSPLVLMVTGDKLIKIMSVPLVEHIGNCLCHIKMLPKYLELGFDRRKFLYDYDTHKCTDAEINLIKSNLGNRVYNSKIVDLFIGKYIAIKSDPNTSFDYSSALNCLKQIDAELFGVLENFYNDWLELDIEVYDLFHNYRDVVSKFYDELNQWASDKTLV